MAIDASLRALDIDLPACPAVLVQLSVLMHDEGANMRIISQLIETDMALASAVVRTVNSAYFGLQRGAGQEGLSAAAGDLGGGAWREGISGSRFLRRLRAASRAGSDERRTISAGGRPINVRGTADSRRAAAGAGQRHLRRLGGCACAARGRDCGRGAIDAGGRSRGRGRHGSPGRRAAGGELWIERGNRAGLCSG